MELVRVAVGTRRSLFVQALGLLLGYVVHVLLARWMGVREYGTYVYVLSWVGLLMQGAALGLPILVVRYLPVYRLEEDWQRLRGLLRWGWRGVLGRGLVLTLVALLLVMVLGDRIDKAYRLALLVGLWLVPVRGLLRLVGGLHQALHRIGWAHALPAMQHGIFLVFAFSLWRWHGNLTSEQAIGSTLVAVIVVLLAQIPLLMRALPGPVREVAPYYENRHWLRVALPMLLVSGSFVALSQTDTLMVGTLLGPNEAGLYQAASKMASLVGLVLAAAGGASAPVVAMLYAEGNQGRLQHLLSKTAHWIFWPSLAVALGLVVAAEPVLRIFGTDFVPARWTLILLVGGQLVHAGAGAVAGVLNWTGYQKQAAAVLATSVVVNILLNGIGIMLFGIEGAALATAMSIIGTNVVLCRMAQRRAGVNPSIVYALRHASARSNHDHD